MIRDKIRENIAEELKKKAAQIGNPNADLDQANPLELRDCIAVIYDKAAYKIKK